ncbi:toxin-antitoxin system YwqK family antitoxin [Cellulophaga sp. 20_2_10]|uniref:toxin-antitoxin system YwqK family antitoxin n=1 Tax=Cellulophaga sp. 20_2_10 TaxID=2942476 RepID=UPI00201A47DE|nr:toxin-antitoxin system YwqK family antitoxin [Cellulophaga sp. 20_2_10]MCL5244551.1 toxin-antitoxin system YwqK family antitoxin [Cellulophaga sp. 20_2_10]
MNYTLISFISYFQEITKVRQLLFYKLVLILLVASISSCTPVNLVSKKKLEVKNNLGLVYYNNELFTGLAVTFYKHGGTSESISYQNGKKHGDYQKWFSSGDLSYEAYYKNGKKEGVAKSWWANGNLRSKSIFTKGIVNGLQKQWYNTGAKFKEMNIVNGKENGIQKSWRKNGKVYNNYEAKDGRIFGLKRANLCFQLENEVVQVK